MSRHYEAPALEQYGTLAALTASGVKCTPGSTDGGYSYTGQGTWIPGTGWVIDTGGATGPDITIADFDRCRYVDK